MIDSSCMDCHAGAGDQEDPSSNGRLATVGLEAGVQGAGRVASFKAFRALFEVSKPGIIVSKTNDERGWSWWVSRDGDGLFSVSRNWGDGTRELIAWGSCGGRSWGNRERAVAAWELEMAIKKEKAELEACVVGGKEKKSKARSL